MGGLGAIWCLMGILSFNSTFAPGLVSWGSFCPSSALYLQAVGMSCLRLISQGLLPVGDI